ncbi:MAG: hypothetical protein ACOYZ8_08190 [Chloroflexota bacterium]
MKKRTISLALVAFVVSLACQLFFPATREGTVISDCAETVAAFRRTQPGPVPENLERTGVKQGGEFDANDYFDALTHISMQAGYTLDYVYSVDSLGAYPILYARPAGQPPYASTQDIPENMEQADFRDHLEIQDAAQGYFEYVMMDILAGQFYLVWHANYNDTRIVCNDGDVNAIIADVNDGDFGMKFDLSQQAKARAMTDIEPAVQLTEDAAIVEVIVFTKWGGFYRQTYTISRSFPHTIIDVKSKNLVEYDCGVMF